MRKQILRERGALGVVGASNKEIPSWLRFPDSERVEWLNQVGWKFVDTNNLLFFRCSNNCGPTSASTRRILCVNLLNLKFWLKCQVILKLYAISFVNLLILAPFKSFRFIDIDMGDAPCRVSGLKVRCLNLLFLTSQYLGLYAKCRP